jgi:hypothetical protein
MFRDMHQWFLAMGLMKFRRQLVALGQSDDDSAEVRD